jgi:hypothetical protein
VTGRVPQAAAPGLLGGTTRAASREEMRPCSVPEGYTL